MNRAVAARPARPVVPSRAIRVRARIAESALPVFGLAGVLLTSVGMSGVGDAPDPHEAATAMAEHFSRHRDDVLSRAPFGYLGAVLLLCFALGLANLLRDRSIGRATVGTQLGIPAAGLALTAYFTGLQLDYTSIAYSVARSSPLQTKAMYEPTILASPLLALTTTALLWTAAAAGWRTYRLPRWWSLASAAAGLAAAAGVFGYADGGWLSPDVQQQICGNLALVWVGTTAVVVLTTTRRR